MRRYFENVLTILGVLVLVLAFNVGLALLAMQGPAGIVVAAVLFVLTLAALVTKMEQG